MLTHQHSHLASILCPECLPSCHQCSDSYQSVWFTPWLSAKLAMTQHEINTLNSSESNLPAEDGAWWASVFVRRQWKLSRQMTLKTPLKFKTTGRIYSEFIAKPQLGRSQPSYHFGLIFAWSPGCSLLLLCAAWGTLAAVLLHQQVFGSWFSALDFLCR